jgi:hypothetical protein
VSRHLADCAGDDYCDGSCRYGYGFPADKPYWARSWVCLVHGQLGEINGPVHYEVCSNRMRGTHNGA